MRVRLFDRTEYIVSKDNADKIASAIEADVKFIKIQGDLIKPNAIAAILKGGESPIPPERRIEAPPRTPEEQARADAALERLRETVKQIANKKKIN